VTVSPEVYDKEYGPLNVSCDLSQAGIRAHVAVAVAVISVGPMGDSIGLPILAQRSVTFRSQPRA